jgi:hypothetical protein
MAGRRGPDGLPLFWGTRGRDASAHPGMDKPKDIDKAVREAATEVS